MEERGERTLEIEFVPPKRDIPADRATAARKQSDGVSPFRSRSNESCSPLGPDS